VGFTSVQSLDEASGAFIALSLEIHARHIHTNGKRFALTQSSVCSTAVYLKPCPRISVFIFHSV
jgi:hypothetical protein